MGEKSIVSVTNENERISIENSLPYLTYVLRLSCVVHGPIYGPLMGFYVNGFYGVRGVSQIKFTMSDSFLVFYDFDILSMIKRKNPFRFYCVILILNLSRLISQMHF